MKYPPTTPRKILIVQPNWVGDAVMATPMLRAMRELFPNSHISYLMRRYVKPIYAAMPWADQLITYRTGRTRAKAGKGIFDLARRLRSADFDMAVLLPNSFRTALICKMAAINRVVGYDRDGRSFLLTDRLLVAKDRGKFVPTPLVKTYLGVAQYLGSAHRDLSLKLFITDSERRRAGEILARSHLDAAIDRPASRGQSPLIMLNPGALYGQAKCWLPEHFAQLADRLVDELGAQILLSAAPKERRIVDAILRQMKHAAVDLHAAGLTLGALKELIRRCDLLITNDTGPRHIAAALDVPVVTIFGPTHPQWTEIYYAKERQVAVKVFCGPCQKKTCPLDHRCMTRISPAMVFDAALSLLPRRQAAAPAEA